MSDSILQQIQQRLDADAIAEIASKVGVQPAQAQTAVDAALPTLMAALAGNASTESGASSLASALQQHANNPALGNVVEMLSQGMQGGAGQAILGHVLGDRQADVQATVGAAAGIQPQQVGQIFSMLAPVIMGVLGQKGQESGGLNVGSLMQMMQQEGSAAEASGGGALMGMLGGLLSGQGGGASSGGGGLKGALAQQGLKALSGFLKKK